MTVISNVLVTEPLMYRISF